MRFSTRTTYGLRALNRLADHYGRGSLSVARIAEDEHISQGYLERIFSQLKKAGVVVAEKGVQGGYRLAEEPKKIKIYDILKSLEGNIAVFHCIDEQGGLKCSLDKGCTAAKVLTRVQGAIHDSLKNLRLSDLV